MVYLSMICLTLLTVGHAVWPLLRGAAGPCPEDGCVLSPPQDSRVSLQIQELELDYASGKLTSEDYRIALAEMQIQEEGNRTNP
jgi:hypothetical protein